MGVAHVFISDHNTNLNWLLYMYVCMSVNMHVVTTKSWPGQNVISGKGLHESTADVVSYTLRGN